MRLILLLLVAFSLTEARHRFIREAEDDAEVETTEATQEVEAEVVAETTEAVVETTTKGIKEHNLVKCTKCLKPTFSQKHESFCTKCIELKIVDADEKEKLDTAIICKKCVKAKYKARHADVCHKICDKKEEVEQEVMEEEEVMDEEEDTVEEEETVPADMDDEDKEETAAVEDDEEEEEEEEKETHHSKHCKNKKNEKSRKKCMKKNKNKKNKTPAVIGSVSADISANIVESGEEASSTPAVYELGPLGNLLKTIIDINTWRSS